MQREVERPPFLIKKHNRARTEGGWEAELIATPKPVGRIHLEEAPNKSGPLFRVPEVASCD